MNYPIEKAVLGTLMGLALCSTAGAATINVGDATAGIQAADEITVSTVWTSNNVYNLRDQIYVKNGATLTIQPGTLIRSTATGNGGGSLAITRGSKIMACGTCTSPIIFTSSNDDMVTWRPAANEWGNITVMGRALVGDYVTAGNSPSCNANNVKPMEGLTPQMVGDPNTLMGGGDDDDNSGCLQYVSLRYGGRVLGLGNELNGLSMGAVGRSTVVDHIDIMNNVDDGIETWGGTVNYKYVNIWNIGDDSFDVDCGWRGKAQFGLIVQGYSQDNSQGSGIGDNCFETDGAEKADAQPVTTACIYNFTVIGQPVAGDHGTAWRDGARLQYRNCIFMDLGGNLIHNDGDDGDSGSGGYGFNGTASFLSLWNTAWTVHSAVNACGNPAAVYQAQSGGSAGIQQGFLNEMTDSVFFRNLNAAAYNNAQGSDAVGVTTAGGSNANKGNVVAAYGGAGNPDANMPIKQLVRHAVEFLQNGTEALIRVASIDPRAANAAVASAAAAPNDGFFTPAMYRGGFSSTENWLCGWTAADAYGFVKQSGCVVCPVCVADITDNGASNMPDGNVNVFDLLLLLTNWNTSGTGVAIAAPTNVVDVFDLLQLLADWGPC